MTIRNWLTVSGLLVCLSVNPIHAQETDAKPQANLGEALAEKVQQAAEQQATNDLPPAVEAALLRTFRSDVSSRAKVSPAPLAGFYEVILGSDVFYLSEDGKYLMVGDVRDTYSGQNLTDATRNNLRKTALETMPEEKMVVFAPEGETRYTVNIFTDVDCPYCVKLHEEVPKLNEAGVKVRYLAYPRAGQGSKTYNTMVSVWCADDQQQAMTDAKARQAIEAKQCENPVQDQFILGQAMGVTGTPALILTDGELVPGYVPAERLLAYLDRKAAEAAAETETATE